MRSVVVKSHTLDLALSPLCLLACHHLWNGVTRYAMLRLSVQGSLEPRPSTQFFSQPWKKLCGRPGFEAMCRVAISCNVHVLCML